MEETEEQPKVEKPDRQKSTDVDNDLQEYPPMDKKLVNLGELG